MYGIIYKTTNLINGKIYIGQHRCDTDKFDGYLGSGKNFKRAFIKYGRENFKRETLRVCDTQLQLDAWEFVCIRNFNATDKRIGYNLEIAPKQMFCSEKFTRRPAVRKKLSISRKGKPLPPEVKLKIQRSNLGKKRSEETKKKISLNNVRFKNRRHSEESKALMSAKLKGRKVNEETRLKISNALKGVNTWSKGKKRPAHSEVMKGARNPMFGKKYIWINDGVRNSRYYDGDTPPLGWNRGRVKHENKKG